MNGRQLVTITCFCAACFCVFVLCLEASKFLAMNKNYLIHYYLVKQQIHFESTRKCNVCKLLTSVSIERSKIGAGKGKRVL